MRIGNRDFARQGHTYVMGILNVTPDSFSDGGKYQRIDQALYHVEEMMQDGMDLLDIGGESTRPGYTTISAGEEIERVSEEMKKLQESLVEAVEIRLAFHHHRPAEPVEPR